MSVVCVAYFPFAVFHLRKEIDENVNYSIFYLLAKLINLILWSFYNSVRLHVIYSKEENKNIIITIIYLYFTLT